MMSVTLGDLITGKRLILCLPLRKSEKEDWGTTGQSASSQSLERSWAWPLGTHLQTYKGQEVNKEHLTWIYQEQILLDQPVCILWWKV